MKKILFILCQFVLISSSSLFGGEAWSPFPGKKTWQEAKDHCTGLGLRLPTERELAFAFQSGLNKKWNGGMGAVWTDKENSSLNFKNHFNLYTKDSMLGFSCLDISFWRLTEAQEKNLPIISKWIYSEYQGNLNWDDANKKCISSGMRLPTITELKEAYESKITESWQKDGYIYWSSTPYDAESYYLLNVYNGITLYYNRNIYDYVRCRR